MSAPPSGEQHELRCGAQLAVVTEVGACLRVYRAGERELIDGFALDEHAEGARGQALIPWPNRIRDGRYAWDGETHQLDLTEAPRGNAIHGLVRWRSWRVLDHGPAHVALGIRLHPMPGYWFALELTVTYRLGADGLEVTTRAENIGARACPYGVGFHPYLSIGGPIDAGCLRVPARARLVLDEGAIPTGSRPVAGTPFDFRVPRALGSMVLDDCFCELERDGDGRARIALAGEKRAVVLWCDEAYRYVMVFSGDTLPARLRRRGLAVEPMSCAPNGFASGEGLVRLEPGQVHVASWGIEQA